MSTHSPTVNTNRQRHQAAPTVAKVLAVLTHFILLNSAVFCYQPPPQSWKILPSRPQPNHIPISDLSNSHLRSSIARLAHLAPITPARRLPRPSPFQQRLIP